MKSRITIMYKLVAALLGLLALSNTFVNAQDDLLEREEKALQAAVMKASVLWRVTRRSSASDSGCHQK